MQTWLPAVRPAVQHSCVHQAAQTTLARRRVQLLVSASLQKSRAASTSRHKPLQDVLLSWALLQPAASWAASNPTPLDDPVVQDTIAKVPEGPSLVGGVVLFSPLVLYGIFTIYRTQINPKAKLGNFWLIAAAVVLFANLFSIVVFKVRWF